jgi:hypothetical protein
MRTSGTARVAMGAAVLTGAGWCLAQAPAGGGTGGGAGAPARLVPVEQGVGDVGPASRSLRVAPLDLRQPSDFDRVYRIPSGVGPGVGRGGLLAPPGPGDRFARVNGAVTAVFPRSQYTVTSRGLVPDVPAGTVFYIGRLPAGEVGAGRSPGEGAAAGGARVGVGVGAEGPLNGGAVGALPSGRVEAETVGGPAPVNAPPPGPLGRDRSSPAGGVLTDEGYRRARVRELVMEAARRGAGAEGGASKPGDPPGAATVAAPEGEAAPAGGGGGSRGGAPGTAIER